MSPRRVTILVDSLLGGGAERVAVEAAARLDPDRYAPHLLVTRHTGPLEQLVRERGLDCTILGRRRGFDPRAFRLALAVVGAGDLLHAHKFEGSVWGALLARAARRPLVAHEHTFDGRPSRRRRVGYRLLIAPSARRILCVSEPVARSLVAEGVRRDLLEVVANGVPTGSILDRAQARAELGIRGPGDVIGIVGRLRREKRHELALEALARLREEGRDVTLWCIGDGPRRDELRAVAARLGVAEHVRWAGEVSDARRLARAFDVVVLCSDYEGMPLAALEALVAGTPLVATAVGSLPALLDDGGGRLVTPGDAEALARAVAAELAGRDPSAARRAAERARERFGIDRLVGDIERVYDEVLAGGRP